jgi:hypothetical protein
MGVRWWTGGGCALRARDARRPRPEEFASSWLIDRPISLTDTQGRRQTAAHERVGAFGQTRVIT